MPSANAFQTNFSAGELSPRLYARVDVGKYMNGCSKIENFIVQRFGGIRKRGGTEFINEAKDSAKAVRLIPFTFSVTQAYILEFGDLYIRIYTNGGIVESGGSPVEVVSPYSQSEIFDIQFAQSADVLYIVHPNHAPRQFSRTSATTFTIEEMGFEDGPFLEINDSSTTLEPASYGALTPVMTGLSSPSGTVTSTGSEASAYLVFDKDSGTDGVWGTNTQGFVAYQLPSGSAVVDHYYVTATDGENTISTPINWKIEGSNNGTDWVVLDSRQGESGWAGGETRFYRFSNKTAYSYHRFRWLGVDGSSGTRIAEIGFNKAPVSQTAFNLTASSASGINGGSGFLTTDVGRMIRLQGSDGQWRWAEIMSRTSSTVVTIKLHGQPLPDLSPIINWRLGAWSDETGWPASVGFYNGRLCFARTSEQPQTVWMSVVDDFTSFTVSDPLQDDDAITATVASDSLNEIKWIAEGTELFLGTTASIRTIGPTTSTSAFSPTNIQQKREANYGASDVAPVRVGNNAIYAGYYRKDVREIAYSFDVNGYISNNLSLLSEHIPAPGIKQMAYAQDPDAIVWACDDNGVLFGMTYERDQEVIAFHTHPIGGTSAVVESVATIPGSGSDEVWVLVRRTVNGSTKRYIERLSSGMTDYETLSDATFLDSHLNYSGASATVITGLSHLNGASVYAWTSAGVQGPYTVASGQITLGSAVTWACVGLQYTSVMETLSPEAAARGGTAQTRIGRITEVFLRLDRSMNGKIGPADGTLETIEYTTGTDYDGEYGSDTALFTGDARVSVAMEWERGKRLRVEHSSPTPFHLLGLITEIRVSG
ncbi:hypothetical protein GOB02_21680 [Sinorhizobium meliloti]|nr:hypothetical protein [Sinorhizobium meliloti]